MDPRRGLVRREGFYVHWSAETLLSTIGFDCIGDGSEAEFAGTQPLGVGTEGVADVVAVEADGLVVGYSAEGDVDVGMVCVVVGDGDPLDG